MTTDRPIKRIFGEEPRREGEYPQAYIVGQTLSRASDHVVKRITYRMENYGDHGLGWFDVVVQIDGEDAVLASMSARSVAEVHYDLGDGDA